MEGGLWHLMYSHTSEEGSHCLHALLCNFSLNRLSSRKDKLLNPCMYLFHWDEREEFTYCQIIICFQQTLLLPEICTM